eukprot:CAMPEP_0176135594 /NCGR_PEP_ID=MMETSP0120_2-20121206/68791_1 /TAXON_ID=160619 /ORGANISM="Kryptoperidinium foliaceum, Strain CCMP 1326" /LENGTH=134 /DNA_ID=CAMNT_0017471315 /DNA_START=414 /DNA_END=818 /DNA_ORIENTATION=+
MSNCTHLGLDWNDPSYVAVLKLDQCAGIRVINTRNYPGVVEERDPVCPRVGAARRKESGSCRSRHFRVTTRATDMHHVLCTRKVEGHKISQGPKDWHDSINCMDHMAIRKANILDVTEMGESFDILNVQQTKEV